MGGAGGMYGGGHGHHGGQGGAPGTQPATAANGLKIWTYVKLSSNKGLSPATPQN